MLRRQFIVGAWGALIALLVLTASAICSAHYPNIPRPVACLSGVAVIVEKQERLMERELALYVLSQVAQNGVVWAVNGALMSLLALSAVARISSENMARLTCIIRHITQHRYFLAPQASLAVGYFGAFLTHPNTPFLFLSWASNPLNWFSLMMCGILILAITEGILSIDGRRLTSVNLICRLVLLGICEAFLFMFFPDLQDPIPVQTFTTMGFDLTAGTHLGALTCGVLEQNAHVPLIFDFSLLIFFYFILVETSRRIVVYHVVSNLYARLRKRFSLRLVEESTFWIIAVTLTNYLVVTTSVQAFAPKAFLRELPSWRVAHADRVQNHVDYNDCYSAIWIPNYFGTRYKSRYPRNIP